MKTKKLIMPMLAISLMMPAMQSCHDKDNETTIEEKKPTPDTPEYKNENTENIEKTLVSAKQMPLANQIYTEKEEYRQKAMNFYYKFADAVGCNLTDNIAVSPISAFMVLGMAAESANGDTRKELLDALEISDKDLPVISAILCNDLNRITSESRSMWGEEDGPKQESKPCNLVKSSNSIWFCDRIHFNEAGLKTISNDFYCDLFQTTFKNGVANSLINSYVKNETNGFLDINLKVPEDAVMALMNVLYIKEIWNESGNDMDFTNDKYDFTNSDNSVVNGKLLRGYYADGKAISTDKFRKFYTETYDGYKLTFIVPQDGYNVSDLYNYSVLSSSSHYTEREGKYVYHTRCLFPEFKAEFFESIKDNIIKMGVKQLFIEGGCDFSNLVKYVDGADGVYSSDVKQATRFEVSKSGIEGAAVTIMIMNDATCAPDFEEVEDVYEDFIVDRAFAYTFEDRYGNVLFTGVVNKVE